MIFRKCAGGLVFFEDMLFVLQNDKREWVMPKGVLRGRETPEEVALARVEAEAGISARVLEKAGETAYEFYSQARRQPVQNQISWYVMKAETPKYRIAFEQGFLDGDFLPVEDAIARITYTQDKELARKGYELYRSLR